MATIPQFSSPTVDAIYAAYVKQSQTETRRGHLGASQIGKPCRRSLWHEFRWCSSPEFSGRMLRLFETGKLEEDRVSNNLRAIGCTVHDVDPNTGKQFWFGDHGGHFSGSLDSVAMGIPEAPKTWHVVEKKTHGAKSFLKLKQEGVQIAKPEHLAQMMVYMGWAELERALYFAVCKDTDELYCERIAFDARVFQAERVKAMMIIEAATPPDRHESPLCDWCSSVSLCRGESVPQVSCRTCLYSKPVTTGTGAHWTCGFDNHDIPFLLQQRGCDHHLFIPELLPFAAPVERGDGFVVYQMGDSYFVNSTPASFPACTVQHYSSKDMLVTSVRELAK